jgi:hypothetical protein
MVNLLASGHQRDHRLCRRDHEGRDGLSQIAGTIQTCFIPALTGVTAALTAYAIVQTVQAIPAIYASIPALAAQAAAFYANAAAIMARWLPTR